MDSVTSFDDVLEANAAYAEQFTDPDVPGKAGRGLAVITCMDSRIDPLAVLGLGLGDAKIIRNAGGQVTDEILRTLVLATYLLEVDRVLVLEHTLCKMASATEDDVHRLLSEGADLDTRSLQFGTIADQHAHLADDVQRIRSWPYLPHDLAVAGALYDVQTGRVEVVVPD